MKNLTGTVCARCSSPVDPALDGPGGQRVPCSACGSTARDIDESLAIEATPRVSLKFTHRRPGVKSPLAEGFSGVELRKSVGDHVEKVRLIDRENDRYMERVVTEQGEVLRDIDHKLTEHVGRGSDKPKIP